MNYNLAFPFYRNSLEHPHQMAVSTDDISLSYAELADMAQRISGWIGKIEKKSGRIGILASRSVEACAGVLGICWAGKTYVPFSLKLPEDRLQSVFALSQLDALITDARGAKLLSGKALAAAPKHILVPDKNLLPDMPDNTQHTVLDITSLLVANHAPVEVPANHTAYIIFTSGTTGVPKGVVVSAGAVHHLLSVMQQRYQLTPNDRVSENTDLSFDVSVSNMFMTWGAAASLHIVPPTQAMAPAKFIQEHKLTVWSSVPSVIAFMKAVKALAPGAFPSLRYSLFAGEPVSISAVLSWQQAAPQGIIDNLYGPTEVTVVCIGQRLTDPPTVTPQREVMATGTPFPGMEAAIMDKGKHFLPPGEQGELALSGPQLADGYLDSPDLTESRFPSIDGKRWYRTGDLAYRDAAGIFHHLGRIDNQVKVLGNRVELEDIEAHMRAVCGCEMVAAVAWPVVDGAASGIVGFIAGTDLSAAEIREALKKRLPTYMVPGMIRFIPALPVSSHGKVDRKALIALLGNTTHG